MLAIYKRYKLSGLVFLASLLAIIGIALSTNPSSSAALIILFLILFLSLLISGGFMIIERQGGGRAGRYKAVILGVIATLCIMFRSTHSLSPTDLVILLLTLAGLFFYINRRLN